MAVEHILTEAKGHTDFEHLHTQPKSPPSTNFLDLTFPRYSPDRILKVKVTTARSSQGHTMTVRTYIPQPLSLQHINRSTPYGVRNLAQTKVIIARLNQGHTMMLHMYIPNQCLYQVSTFYTPIACSTTSPVRRHG